jgi:hypothetical protein
MSRTRKKTGEEREGDEEQRLNKNHDSSDGSNKAFAQLTCSLISTNLPISGNVACKVLSSKVKNGGCDIERAQASSSMYEYKDLVAPTLRKMKSVPTKTLGLFTQIHLLIVPHMYSLYIDMILGLNMYIFPTIHCRQGLVRSYSSRNYS